jgi:adenylate cyclase
MGSHARGAMTPLATETPAAGTFVFADLAGYTALTVRWGDEIAAEVAIALADAARRLAAEHGGRLVKSMGDSVMVRTATPAAGVRLGIDLSQAAPALRARVGIHTGPAVERNGDYFGLAVNLAARLAAQAAPGEVLVSEPAWRAAGMRGCGAPARAVPLGPWVLGDAPDPVDVLALASPCRQSA